MPRIKFINTREWEVYDGQYAKWRVNDKIILHKDEVIWRFKSIHDYWIQDNAGADPPSDNYDRVGEAIIYMDHSNIQFITDEHYCLKELSYKKHNGLWHVAVRGKGNFEEQAMMVTAESFDLFIQFKVRTFVDEHEMVPGPHHLNNAYIKDTFIQQLAHQKFKMNEFFKTHKVNKPELGISSKKTFTENAIALNEAELRVLKKAKAKRSGVNSRIEKEVTNMMNKIHGRDLFKYGSTNGDFVQLEYMHPNKACILLKEINSKLNPLDPDNDQWAREADSKQRPFRCSTILDADLGVMKVHAPDQITPAILRDATVGMNSVKNRSEIQYNDLKLKQRHAQNNILKDVVDGKVTNIPASHVLDWDVVRRYTKRKVDLGFVSINDYAFTLLRKYTISFSNEGLLNIRKFFGHQLISRVNTQIPNNDTLTAYTQKEAK